MEESGENWPSDHSDLEVDDDDNDLCSDDEEFGGDDEGHLFSDTVDPVMDESKSKRELSKNLLALSATIPGFKKMDNTSILDKASNYVKQLQERVRELEQEVESNKGTTSCEVNSSDYYYGSNEILPEIKVRVLQKDVLIIIHCEKQKGIMLKILSHLENLNLSVVNSSVLRFGKSTLDITIIAQMGDGYNMTVDELVKTLRVAILTQ
ncbi:transcription factor NAI1-like isoform X2 [Abrus precatorius]|uniref:Transcription factor NAI1-like isoform X2 n=1 Tax=Abrus precatorius TaxID=3816 RepID=A0A8B8KQD0_ABRPR|nr:transcription factor NAI1-like isoform X2 [Abrus precatorius]